MKMVTEKEKGLTFIKEYPFFYLYIDKKTGLKFTRLKCDYVGEEVKKHPKSRWE